VLGLNAIDGCHCIKIHGSAYSTVGTPDIIGSFRGNSFALEVKRPSGNAASKIQNHRIILWERSGAITGVVRSLAEAKEVLLSALTSQE